VETQHTEKPHTSMWQSRHNDDLVDAHSELCPTVQYMCDCCMQQCSSAGGAHRQASHSEGDDHAAEGRRGRHAGMYLRFPCHSVMHLQSLPLPHTDWDGLAISDKVC
jgi:hypothetical protein